MNDYQNAPATKMMATNCICCGRALVDSTSVSLGIGPECRAGFDGGISEETREAANKLVHAASVAAHNGEISTVLAYAEKIRELGLGELADKVAKRFRNADRYAEIVITLEGDMYRVETPFKRKNSDGFIAAWRDIPGRRWMNNANYVPVSSKKQLFSLLKEFFGGKYAKGPKGVFRIPQEIVPKQDELQLAG